MELLTQRLRIRPLLPADFPAFDRTLNDIQRSCMGSGEAFLNWIIGQYEGMDILNGLISLGVFNKQTGELLGTAGAGKHDNLGEPEIFYFLLPEHRGHGYATEAAKAITQWALENYPIPYMIGTAAVDNLPSQRVLEHCGYRYIEDKHLLVHVEGQSYDFKYYRAYP